DRWRSLDYHVSLYFLAVSNVEIAISRVAERVRQGGHHIPEAVIRRRFAAGLHNFNHHYRARVNTWAMYDNSGPEPVLLECEENT
ncbi:MAG: Zeta toxin family protein, partial [Dokdonella sp.]